MSEAGSINDSKNNRRMKNLFAFAIMIAIFLPIFRIGVFLIIFIFSTINIMSINRISKMIKETDEPMPTNELALYEYFQYSTLLFVELLRLLEHHKILFIFNYAYICLALLWIIVAFFYRIKSCLYKRNDAEFCKHSQVIFYIFDFSIVSLFSGMFLSTVFFIFRLNNFLIKDVIFYILTIFFFIVLMGIFYYINELLMRKHNIDESNIQQEIYLSKRHFFSKFIGVWCVLVIFNLILLFITKNVTSEEIIKTYIDGEYSFSLKYFIGIIMFLLLPFYVPKIIAKRFFSGRDIGVMGNG